MTQPTGKLEGIPMPFSVEVDGTTWDLFSVDFSTDGKRFSTYIYALSWEHAESMVEGLKATAHVSGQCVEAYEA